MAALHGMLIADAMAWAPAMPTPYPGLKNASAHVGWPVIDVRRLKVLVRHGLECSEKPDMDRRELLP